MEIIRMEIACTPIVWELQREVGTTGLDHSVAAPLHPTSIYLACGTLTLRLLSLGGGPSSSSRRGMGWFPIEG